jgi:hypothetical protein
MAKKPEPPKAIRWNVNEIVSKAGWRGEFEARDEATVIEKAAAAYHIRPAHRPMAMRR